MEIRDPSGQPPDDAGLRRSARGNKFESLASKLEVILPLDEADLLIARIISISIPQCSLVLFHTCSAENSDRVGLCAFLDTVG